METVNTNCKHWSKICRFSKEQENKILKMSCGLPLDMSMDSMEEMRFKKKHQQLFQKLVKKLHFTYTELECIMLIYYKIQLDGPAAKIGAITKSQFRDVLHSGFDMTDDFLMERTFTALERGLKITGATTVVAMETWASCLSLFLRGSLEEKIDYCFAVYDPLGDGVITRENMFQLLRNTLVKQPGEEDTDEGVKDLVDVIFKKMDIDRDGKISFADYKETVLHTPMFLEVMGPCLPTRMAVHAFLTSFTEMVGKV